MSEGSRLRHDCVIALVAAILLVANASANSLAADARDDGKAPVVPRPTTPAVPPNPPAPPDTPAAPGPPEKPAPSTLNPDAGEDRGGKLSPPQTLQPIPAEEVIGILGKKVRGPADEDMGMVVDVLVDAEAQPRAAVIDFGGFLGVGSRKIAVHWQALHFRPIDRAAPVLLKLGRAEVQAAPEYKPTSQPAEVVAPPTPVDPAPQQPADSSSPPQPPVPSVLPPSTDAPAAPAQTAPATDYPRLPAPAPPRPVPDAGR